MFINQDKYTENIKLFYKYKLTLLRVYITYSLKIQYIQYMRISYFKIRCSFSNL